MTIYKDHEKIFKKLEKECMSVNELVQATKLSVQKVIDHIEIMKMDKNGMFTSEDGEFCRYDVIQNMIESLKS